MFNGNVVISVVFTLAQLSVILATLFVGRADPPDGTLSSASWLLTAHYALVFVSVLIAMAVDVVFMRRVVRLLNSISLVMGSLEPDRTTRVAAAAALAKELGLHVAGVSFHVGSGCRDATRYEWALRDCKKLFEMAGIIEHRDALVQQLRAHVSRDVGESILAAASARAAEGDGAANGLKAACEAAVQEEVRAAEALAAQRYAPAAFETRQGSCCPPTSKGRVAASTPASARAAKILCILGWSATPPSRSTGAAPSVSRSAGKSTSRETRRKLWAVSSKVPRSCMAKAGRAQRPTASCTS
jgi:hypothetical protein